MKEKHSAHDKNKQNIIHNRFLFVLYILLCLFVSLIILKSLFKNRLSLSAKESNEFSIQKLQSVLHDEIINSRWPLNAFRYHDKIGYEMTPSFSAKMLDNSFHIKSHKFGYRIPLFQDQESFQKGGIISVGCSFTYGDHVEAEETFTFQAGKLLELPTYNYGVPSYSYVSSLLQLIDLEKKGILDKLSPSILLLGAGKWMEHRSASPFFPTNRLQFGYAYLGKEDNKIVIKQPKEIYSLKHLFEFRKRYFPDGKRITTFTPQRKRLIAEIIPRIMEAVKDRENFSEEVTPYEIYSFIIPSMYQIASSHNMKFIILWMPGSSLDEYPSPTLKKVLSSYKDIILVNGTAAIRNIPPAVTFTEDGHPSVSGHKIFAQTLASRITREVQN